MPLVSIIIRCYNEEKQIGKFLEGIKHQALQDLEIILVDSGSTDATLAIASRYPVKIISINKDDFSFGYSLNVGCEAAKGKYLVIASAHVYPVYHDWLEKLISPFEDEKVALVYGKQRGNETTNFSEHQVFAKWFPDQSDLKQGHPFCNNANAAIRRIVWERFSYDETLTGLEDLAWAKQALAAGYRIAYEANAVIIHVHDESPPKLFNRYRREAIALKATFPQEHFNLFDFVTMYFQNVINDLVHARQSCVLWGNIGNIFTFRLMQFWGTYRGFSQHGLVTQQLKQKFYYPAERNQIKSPPMFSEEIRPVIDYSSMKEKENT